MACPRLLGKSCGFSNGKYLFAIFRDIPRHCSYTKRWQTLEMTHSEFNDIYFKQADKVLRNHGFWRQNSHYIKQNDTEFFIIYKNTKRTLFFGFNFVFCHSFMKNLDGDYPDKIMLPEVSPFVFSPTELKKLMKTENGLNNYEYNYERINEKSGTGNLPIDIEKMTEKDASEYIEPILTIAFKEGLEFLKELKPEFTLYQLKEFGTELWIEQNWISNLEKHITDKKRFANTV